MTPGARDMVERLTVGAASVIDLVVGSGTFPETVFSVECVP